jgi:Mce-associated membrane protein
VPIESDTGAEQDEALVAEETTGHLEPETDKPEDAGDAEDSSDTDDHGGAQDASVGDAEIDGTKKRGLRSLLGRITWPRVFAFAVLPVLALSIAAAAGFLKWQDSWNRTSALTAVESIAAAKESTVALLSYQPDSVEKDLGAAQDRLTGKFKDSYKQLVHDVVIPGAKKDHISAVATVPAAASVSATPNHAVVLVYVDQTVTVGNDAPTETASTVRVSMDKSGERWLISGFDPV